MRQVRKSTDRFPGGEIRNKPCPICPGEVEGKRRAGENAGRRANLDAALAVSR
jgi:hypothetical protein